eukprot:scaffold8075_cov484-Prasinococcus_capsulatus_cf.AAC.1
MSVPARCPPRPSPRSSGARSSSDVGAHGRSACDMESRPRKGGTGVRAQQLIRQLRQVFSMDSRALALFRIGVGLFVMYDVCHRSSDSLYWYTSIGPHMFPKADTPHHSPVHQALFYRGSYAWQAALMVAQLLVAASFTLGIHARRMSVALWLLLTMEHGRMEYNMDGADKFLRHMVFWVIFLPCDLHYTCNPFGTKRRGARQQGSPPQHVLCFGTAGFSIQHAIVYFELVGRRCCAWMFPQLDAVYYMLASRFCVSKLGFHLSKFYGLCRVLTGFGMLAELVSPLFLLFSSPRGYWRLAGCLPLIGLHAGIFMTMRLFNFPVFSMLVTVPFLPSHLFVRVEVLLNAIGDTIVGPWSSRMPTYITVISPKSLSPRGSSNADLLSSAPPGLRVEGGLTQ